MELDYAAYQVEALPPTLFYLPDFISKEEEWRLLDRVKTTPNVRWTQLSNRRLQNWGGVPHPKGMIPEQIPEWLSAVVDRVNALGAFAATGCSAGANHVLLNEYLSGQGIMAHSDGDLFFPLIATISLGSHTVLNFYEPIAEKNAAPLEDRIRHRVLLQPRSLVLIKDELYHHFLHGIDEVTEDKLTPDVVNCDASTTLPRSTRISLTIRNVPKTSKFKLRLGR